LERLADRVGMTTGNLSQVERGTTAYTQNSLEAIAEALDCEPADLLMRNPADASQLWAAWTALRAGDHKLAAKMLLKALAEEEAA